MRAEIAEVMRFSGPRIVLYHPVVAFRHLSESRKQKKKLAQNAKKEVGAGENKTVEKSD